MGIFVRMKSESIPSLSETFILAISSDNIYIVASS